MNSTAPEAITCPACAELERLCDLDVALASNPALGLLLAEQCTCGGCDASFKDDCRREIRATFHVVE